MNDLTKKQLYHSWGSSPERKQLERNYNASYYKSNRDRILQNAKIRAVAQKTNSNPYVIYEDTDDFMDHSKKALNAIKSVFKVPAKAVKATGKAVKRGINWLKDNKDVFKRTITAIKNSAPVQAVKNFFKKLKYYTDQSYV